MKRIYLAFLLFCMPSFASTTVLVNDTNWAAGRSPYVWFTSGSSYTQAVNPGAYFKIGFSGTSASLGVDVSAMSGASVPAKQYPQITWQVDGGAWTTYQLLSTDTQVSLASSLSNTTHSLEAVMLSSDALTPRWTGEMSLKITNLVLDTGASTSAATLNTKRMILFGDSITEGAWVLGDHSDLTNYSLYEQSISSWAVLVAAGLNVEYGQASFGGQSWTMTYNGDIPPFPSAWNFYFSSNSRLSGGLLSPAPDYVMINMGTNDGAVPSATVTSWLTTIRGAAPLAKVFMVIPFDGNVATSITTGFNDYQASAHDSSAFLINLGSAGMTYSQTIPTYSFDGLHPNVAGDVQLGSLVLAAVMTDLQAGEYQTGLYMSGSVSQ